MLCFGCSVGLLWHITSKLSRCFFSICFFQFVVGLAGSAVDGGGRRRVVLYVQVFSRSCPGPSCSDSALGLFLPAPKWVVILFLSPPLLFLCCRPRRAHCRRRPSARYLPCVQLAVAAGSGPPCSARVGTLLSPSLPSRAEVQHSPSSATSLLFRGAVTLAGRLPSVTLARWLPIHRTSFCDTGESPSLPLPPLSHLCVPQLLLEQPPTYILDSP